MSEFNTENWSLLEIIFTRMKEILVLVCVVTAEMKSASDFEDGPIFIKHEHNFELEMKLKSTQKSCEQTVMDDDMKLCADRQYSFRIGFI